MDSRKVVAWFKVVSGTLALIAMGTGVMLTRLPQSQVAEVDVQPPVQQKLPIHNAVSPNLVSLSEVKNLLSSTIIETKSPSPKKTPFSQSISTTKISRNPDDDSNKNPLGGQPPYGGHLRADIIKLLRAGKLDEAERKVSAAIAFLRSKNFVDGNLDRLLADIQLEKGEYRKALENYHVNRPASMRHIPHYAELCLKIALCYLRLGEIEASKKFYGYATNNKLGQSVSAELPGVADRRALEASILTNLGFYAETVADSERALNFYQAANKMAPQNSLLLYRQAMLLMWLKRYDEALPMLARAVRFGNTHDAKDAKNRMAVFPVAEREKAMREVANIP